MERNVPSDIAECSSFNEANRMDLDDMLKIATIIDVRPGVNDGSYV